MDEPLFPLDREMRKLFFQIGATAANNLKGVEALSLFQALELAEPDQAYPKVGIGLSAILMGDFQSAAEYLSNPIVHESPLAASANSFLALAHHLNGNASGFKRAVENTKTSSQGEFDDVLQDLASSPSPDIARV
jgi:hypothetical protein